MNETKLTAIILDYGNVIYKWNPYAAISGNIPIAQWEDFVENGNFYKWNELSDAGQSPDAVTALLAATYPQRTDWVHSFQCYWKHFFCSLTGPVPGMREVIAKLIDSDIALYCLTNFNYDLFRQQEHLSPQLRQFAGIVISGKEHCIKPNPEIFHILLHRYGLDPSQTLFVDDSLANIRTAEKIGLHTHHFRSAERLYAELTSQGVVSAPVD